MSNSQEHVDANSGRHGDSHIFSYQSTLKKIEDLGLIQLRSLKSKNSLQE